MKSFLLLTVLLLSLICGAQNIGIGTNSPIARLEVKGEGNNSLTNNLVLKNSIGDTLFRIRNDGRMSIGYNGISFGRTINLGGNGINFFRTDDVFGGSVFPTDTSIVMWSQIGDNNYVILQPSWGRVGIGTFSPQALLHVNGEFILGEAGTVLSKVLKISLSKNIAIVVANATNTETFVVPGAVAGSTVSISPEIALPDGLLIACARVSGVNQVEVKFANITTQPINAPSIIYHITVIK